MPERGAKTHRAAARHRKSSPQYEQIAGILRTEILRLDSDGPVRIPSDRDLCSIHNVSRITIRKAMEIMVRDGLVQCSHTHGSLTVPVGVQRWMRLRQGGVLHVLTGAGTTGRGLLRTDLLGDPGAHRA